MDKDPYKVLGVSQSASKEEIHRAFRSLAAKHHPDKNPEDQESASALFKEVTAAFEILGDESRRRQYDMYREGKWQPSFSFRSRNSVDDIFNNMFSQFFGDQRSSAGSRIRVKVTLEEAYFGCSKKVDLESHKSCDTCQGTGLSSWESCSQCSGRGFFSMSEGSFSSKSACISCSGRGKIPRGKCSSCSGRGYDVLGSKQIEVSIPAGVDNGFQVRIPGQGNDGQDLFLFVSVEKHERFERRNQFLVAWMDIPYSKLVLGGSEEFDLFGSKISIKIPSRSLPSSKLRIRGRGMPMPQNPNLRGDLILELRLKVPAALSKEHEDLLSKLLKIES